MFTLNNCTYNCRNTTPGEKYWVSFDEKSFTKGPTFKVYKGQLNGKGPRSDSRCVVKVFRHGSGTEELCRYEMMKSQKAQDLAKLFNNTIRSRNTKVKFVHVFWDEIEEISLVKKVFYTGKRKLSEGEMVLIEEDLRIDEDWPEKRRKLITFMDCQGKSSKCTSKDLDAFVHFTYDNSGGQLVLSDLNGVQNDKGFVLKTPTIHSRHKDYGDKDRGLQGILHVFGNHVCNDVCKNMIKPLEMHNEYREVNSRLTSAADFMRLGDDHHTLQDASNNNGPNLDNPETTTLDTLLINPQVGFMGHGFGQQHYLNSMCNFSYPSAPQMEAYKEGTLNPVLPPYDMHDNQSVAKWIQQELHRNRYTPCVCFQPGFHPSVAPITVCHAMPHEVGRAGGTVPSSIASISQATTNNLDLSDPCMQNMLNNSHCGDSGINMHCGMNIFTSNSSVHRQTSTASSFSCSCSGCSSPTWTPGGHFQSYNTNLHILDRPPSYEDSQMANL